TFGEPGEVEGRRLVLTYRGDRREHQGRGTYTYRLPQLPGVGSAPFNAFLLDPHVRPVLARWGLELEGEAPLLTGDGEVGYAFTATYWGDCGAPASTLSATAVNSCNANNGNATRVGPL